MLPVRRQSARSAALCAAALLIGLAIAGCGHRGSSSAPSTATPQAIASSVSAPSDAAGEPSVSTGASASASAATAAATEVVPPTPDPVASELDQIDSLIKDIDHTN